MSVTDSQSIALIGNVNTEEIIARTIIAGGGWDVDGFLLSPNEAFTRRCRNAVLLDPASISTSLPERLAARRYDVVYTGPISAALAASDTLRAHGIPHVGATPRQLAFEIDKTQILQVFSPDSGVLPRTTELTAFNEEAIRALLAGMPAGYVLKFVGEYGRKFSGSETGRVRFSGETLADVNEALAFLKASLEISGKAVVQEKLIGQEFSANYVVDAAGHIFRLGENVCYKRRNNGNNGPICDGTGSVSIGNSLPFLTDVDRRTVEENILRPFHAFVSDKTGETFCAVLNLDLMKTNDGRIVLFEVNCREAGGHTMANILSGLATPFGEVLRMAQESRLHEIAPVYRDGASLVVSAYAPYFPAGTTSDAELLTIEVTKQIPDDVHLYTGWVEVLEDRPTSRVLKAMNSPTLLFEHRGPTIEQARARLYEVIRDVVRGRLDYRSDL